MDESDIEKRNYKECVKIIFYDIWRLREQKGVVIFEPDYALLEENQGLIILGIEKYENWLPCGYFDNLDEILNDKNSLKTIAVIRCAPNYFVGALENGNKINVFYTSKFDPNKPLEKKDLTFKCKKNRNKKLVFDNLFS